MLRALTHACFLGQTLKNEVEELRRTVRALTQTTVNGTIKKILDYGARPLSEFNKFEALDMLEALQNTARDHGDTKAGFFRLAYQLARSKLDLPVENKGDFCLIGSLEITLTHALYHHSRQDGCWLE